MAHGTGRPRYQRQSGPKCGEGIAEPIAKQIEKMKLVKLVFFWTGAILAIAACGVSNGFSTAQPAHAPIETLTIPPSVIPRQAHTPIPTHVILLPTFPAPSFPTWVADFSNPILTALNGQQPTLADSFPSICIAERKKWKVCSTPEQRTYYQADDYDGVSISELPLATARPTLDLQPDLQNGYTLLNKGWFYVFSDDLRKPFYANIDSGVLVLSLPNGKENKDFWVYNPRFLQKNFVLEFDLQFDQTQPNDRFRFQFEQGANESFALDLAKNKLGEFHWGPRDHWQSRAGGYEYFPSEQIRVLIIARGNQCAVYLNNVPLDYFENCRADANAQTAPQSASFHLLAEPGHAAMLTLDNIKMWDLDKITIQTPSP
jgi:hypothetical protein